jgi:hypothetical protein
MSVRIVEEKFVTPLTCSRCEYAWNYSGKNTYVATCPYCRTKLSISKNRREVPQTGISPQSPQPVETEVPNGGKSNGKANRRFS